MPRSRAAPAPASRASAAAPRPKPAASSSSAFSSSPASSHPQAPPPAAPAAPAASSSSWFGSRQQAPAPAPPAPAPPPALQSSGGGGGLLSGLVGSVVQGAALGTGSAIAHRAVDSFMGPRETRVVHEHQGGPPAAAPAPAAPLPQQAEGPCADRAKQFAECMSRYDGDMGACQPYFDAMQQCRTQFAA